MLLDHYSPKPLEVVFHCVTSSTTEVEDQENESVHLNLRLGMIL